MKSFRESPRVCFILCLTLIGTVLSSNQVPAASILSALGLQSSSVPPLDVLEVPTNAAPAVMAFAEGLDLLQSGRFAAAVAPLSRAVDEEEENADYLLARGVAQLLAEKVAPGRKDLERAFRLKPKDDDVRRMLAFALRLEGDQLNAPRYYSHASTDPHDQFLRKTGDDYGALVPASQVPSPEFQKQAQQRRQSALAQFPQIGRMFAEKRKQGGSIGQALFSRGVQRFKSGDYGGAAQDCYSVLQEDPANVTSRFYYAAALISLARLQQGRQEMTTVLSWKPALMEAYCQRAIAAARMGDLAKAEHDLDLASKLDPKDTRRARAGAQKTLAECKSRQPRETPMKLYDELLAASRNKESFDKLVRRGELLLRAANNRRLWGDEEYQEKRRELSWLLASAPKNPDKLASLAKFLIDETDVSGECVEPNGQWIQYRQQTAPQQARELVYARQLLNEAAKLSPNHVPTLVGLAALEMRAFQWSNAETILRRAMQIRNEVPEVLELMSRVMQVAADQRAARAAELRETKSWTEYGYNVTWYYTRYPSLEERDRADEYDRQAARLLEESKQYFQKALKAWKGTAQGFYYEGVLAWNDHNPEAARKALEQALTLAPNDRRTHQVLANLYANLGLTDASLEQQAQARNLEQTTAAPWLQRAWSKIVNNAWKTSRAALDKALALDPIDARIPAYLATIAEAQQQDEDAIAYYLAALAIEEAHARQRGTTYAGGTETWPVNDFGHALAIRLRLGRLIQPRDAAQAAALFLQNVALEDRITEWGFSSKIQTAMLPDAQQDVSVTPFPPIAGAVLRKSRALAGIALTRAGQFKEATAQFDRLAGYEARLRGGGTAYLDTGDDISNSPMTMIAAAEAYDGAGHPVRAVQWLQQAEHKANSQWAGGKSAVQDPEFQRVKGKVISRVQTSYLELQNQALAEIKNAAASDREAVRERWQEQLRPIYTACESVFREQSIDPPWQALSGYSDFQEQVREQPPRAQAELQWRTWLQQESRRIQSLPANQRREAWAEFERKVREHQQQLRTGPGH